MLKILGSFKIVPDLDLLSEEDWTVGENDLVDTSFVKTIWNCFDESALEMMLRLSDLSESFGIDLQLDAMTIGNQICDNYLRTLYALGFERASRIECEEQMQFWPELTAGLIAAYWSRYGGQNVIIMGQQSVDGENGKTPLLVAERLGWDCVTQVMGIGLIDEEHLKVTNLVDGCVCTRTVKLPCVLSVGEVPGTYLRVPTLKDRMKKGKRSINLYTADELQVSTAEDANSCRASLRRLEPVIQRRDGLIIEGDSPEEKVKILYQSYLKGRLEGI